MRIDFLDAFQGADTVVRVFSEKTFDKGLDLFRDVWWFGEFGFGVKNGKKDILFFGGIERRPSVEELIKQNS